MNNAIERYAKKECYPYPDCFDNEIYGHMEIWQNSCGEFVFEYPGFTYKFPENGKGFENHYNFLSIEIGARDDEKEHGSLYIQVQLNG